MSNVSTAVARQDEARSGVQDLRQAIERQRDEFARGLPAHVDVDRFVRGALNALNANPKLAACTRVSVLLGLSQAAQLGLEVNDVRGQCFLIPREVSKKDGNGQWYKEATAALQLGWKGLIDLAARSGIIVDAGEIRENDNMDYQLGTSSRFVLRPKLGERGRVIGYYSAAQFADGRSAFEVMSLGEVEDHRDKFASTRDYNTKAIKGPWVDHFDAMARKTVIRKLLNRLPQAVEFARGDAIEAEAYEALPHVAAVPSLPANVDGATGEIGSGTDQDADAVDADVVDAPAAEPAAPPPQTSRPRTRTTTPLNAGAEYGDVKQTASDAQSPAQMIEKLARPHGVNDPDNIVAACSQVVGKEIASLQDLDGKQVVDVKRFFEALAEGEGFPWA